MDLTIRVLSDETVLASAPSSSVSIVLQKAGSSLAQRRRVSKQFPCMPSTAQMLSSQLAEQMRQMRASVNGGSRSRRGRGCRRLHGLTYGHRKGAVITSYGMTKGRHSGETRLDVLQGTLDLMVLQVLDSLGPQHGYGIARRIEQVSEDLLTLNEGTVYTALMRLQHQRSISASWGASDNNRKAKFYAITVAGRRQLAREVDTWDRLAGVIARLRTAGQP